MLWSLEGRFRLVVRTVEIGWTDRGPFEWLQFGRSGPSGRLEYRVILDALLRLRLGKGVQLPASVSRSSLAFWDSTNQDFPGGGAGSVVEPDYDSGALCCWQIHRP